MNWLFLFIMLLVVNLLTLIYFPTSTLKEIALIIVSAFLGVIGFSLKDFFKEIKERKKIKNIQKTTVDKFNRFFSTSLKKTLNKEGLDQEDTEIAILTKLIENGFTEKDSAWRNGLILCYYCRKWNETKEPYDFDMIRQYAENIGIKYGELNGSVKEFLDTYRILIVPAESSDYNDILRHFTTNYYKDLQFYELREELHQTKNFHDTLVTIIKEGKLSTYGISKDTLKKLEHDLRETLQHERTFLLIINKTSDRLKKYLKTLPRLAGVATIMRNVGKNVRVAMHVVKIPYRTSLKEFSEIIKIYTDKKDDTIIRIIPVDLLNSENITLPPDLRFTKSSMQKCYEAIEWFKSGLASEDSLVWNEIAKSSVTPEELLSIIPFNIFCPEILPSEQAFFIKHYDYLKEKLNVNKLNEWKDKKPQLIVNYLMEKEIPEYTNAEKKQLKINGEDTKQKIEKRLLTLAQQIRTGAKEFDKSVGGLK